MPVQTERLNGRLIIPDGCKVLIKWKGSDMAPIDIGITKGDVTNSVEWKESKEQTGNASILDAVISEMKVSGKISILTHESDVLEMIHCGLATKETTAGTAFVPSAQVVAGSASAPWEVGRVYPLELLNVGGVAHKVAAKPVLASVVLDAGSSPHIAEALTVETDYDIVAYPASSSGWGIVFTETGITESDPTQLPITITFGSNAPIVRETIYIGSTSQTLRALELTFIQSDGNGNERGLTQFNVTTKSGIPFNFAGQGAEGHEAMDWAYEASVDTSKTTGKQLMKYWIDSDFAA